MNTLINAEIRLDEKVNGARWTLYGFDIKYANSCRVKYIITVNDWKGNECFFVLDKYQFANDDRLRRGLNEAYSTLASKR